MSHRNQANGLLAGVADFLQIYPWKSALFVVLVVASFVFDVLWLWGFFWIWWAGNSVLTGQVIFLDVVQRSRHPYLFWIMIVCWTLLGVSYLAAEFYPQLLEV